MLQSSRAGYSILALGARSAKLGGIPSLAPNSFISLAKTDPPHRVGPKGSYKSFNFARSNFAMPVFLEGCSSWKQRAVCQRRPKLPGASYADSKVEISILEKFARSKGEFIRN